MCPPRPAPPHILRPARGGSTIATPPDPPDLKETLARLSRVPSRLATAVTTADDDAAFDRRPPAGGLTAREALAMMADLELNVRWTAQAARLLRERDPVLAPVEREIRVVEHAYRNQDARVSVGAYTLARKHLLTQLARLAPEDWARTAGTPDGGRLTLAEWAARLLREDEGLLAAIERCLAPHAAHEGSPPHELSPRPD